MRVAFLVIRQSYLKHFAGLVEEALGRGFEVTLLCDHTGEESQPTGWKGHEFPHLDALPCFVNGAPVVHAYTSLDELVGLVEGRGIEVLFCIGRKPVVERLRERVPPPRLFVAQLQTAWDSLVLHVGVHNLHTFDAIYGFSPHWVAWWASYQVLHGRIPAEEGEAALLRMKERFVPVGFAEAEQLKYVDVAATRRRLGLPEGRPVVLFLPFPFQSVARDLWVHGIYGAPRPLAWLTAAVRGRRFLPHVRRGWTDRALVRALRAFCHREGALLVVKSRMKTPVPRYVRHAADRVLYDESPYPATILELLAVAALCVHFYSFSLSEAAYAGVPSLCVSPTAEEWPRMAEQKMGVRDFSTAEGAFYNFPGVVWGLGVPATLERLRTLRLGDLAVVPARRREFMEKFFGFDDLDVAARVLDDLARRRAL